MEKRLQEVLAGKGRNYIAPFFWQHGESEESLVTEIEKIQECGIQALCVESRPHEDFCGDGWWHDMDIILSECDRRNMKVWLLDDKHFPTGYSNGILKNKDRSLRRWEITERHMDLCGPVREGMVLADAWLGGPEDKIIAVLACERETEGEKLTGRVYDLTEEMADGVVYVTLPEGVYRIIFLIQERSNIPEWRSLYCDQLLGESVDALIEAVYEPHLEHYHRYFGKTFAGFFSDEPCFGNQDGSFIGLGKRYMAYPWREELLPFLEEQYGSNPIPILPALWFDMGEELTAKVRIGFMNVITRLYQKNFSEKLGEWCRTHGVSYMGHIIEDNNTHTKTGASAGHFFRSMEGQDLVGIDVVLHQIIPGLTEYESAGFVSYESMDPVFFHYALAKLAASQAHLQPLKKGRAMCEMYGAYGWAEGVKMMKWLTDHMLVRGINFFVPHAFSPKFPDPDCPPHFYAQGKNPQYRAFGELMRYANRMCHLLNDGVHIASCGILYQAEAEWSGGNYMPMQVPAKELYDRQIDYEFVPSDYLMESIIQDGMLMIGNHVLPALVIPYAQCLPESVIRKVREISEAGVPIYYIDSIPEYTPEGNKPTEWCKESETLHVVPIEELAERFVQDDLWDVRTETNDSYLRVFHYIRGGTDFYMLFNENIHENCENNIYLKGFNHGEYGIYYAMENELVKGYSVDGRISIYLPPYQSIVLVLSQDSFGEKIPLIPKEHEVEKIEEIEGSWDVFKVTEEQYPQYEKCTQINTLCSLSAPGRLPDFSGHILYRKQWKFEPNPRLRYWMDLGDAGETVSLKVNGRSVGCKIVPPYCFDVTKELISGENLFEIEVTTHLGYKMRDTLSRYLLLEPSGLLGPVRLICCNEV